VEGIIPVHIPGLKSEGGIFCCFSMIMTTTMRFIGLRLATNNSLIDKYRIVVEKKHIKTTKYNPKEISLCSRAKEGPSYFSPWGWKVHEQGVIKYNQGA